MVSAGHSPTRGGRLGSRRGAFRVEGFILSHRPGSARCGRCRPHATHQRPAPQQALPAATSLGALAKPECAPVRSQPIGPAMSCAFPTDLHRADAMHRLEIVLEAIPRITRTCRPVLGLRCASIGSSWCAAQIVSQRCGLCVTPSGSASPRRWVCFIRRSRLAVC
jgi:hypothetical protein